MFWRAFVFTESVTHHKDIFHYFRKRVSSLWKFKQGTALKRNSGE